MKTYIINGSWEDIHDYVIKFPKQNEFCIIKNNNQQNVYLRSLNESVIVAILHRFQIEEVYLNLEVLESSSTFGTRALFFPDAN